jgi:hypothetical protein
VGAQPQFAGFGVKNAVQAMVPKAVDTLIPTFEKITEVFLWAYLAQDVLSMWVPRIRQSLVRGAIEYDPTTDPENKGMTPWQLSKKYWTKTLQGLNWVNFNEETKREFATGPGVLFIPTLAFMLARRTFGKTSVELGYGPLTQLTDSFKHHLANSGIAAKDAVTPLEYRTELQKFLKSRFGFSPALMNQQIQVIADAANPAVKSSMKLEHFVDQWVNHWVDTAFNLNKLSGADQAKALSQLEHTMSDAVINGVNRTLQTAEHLYSMDNLPVRLMDRVKNAAAQSGHDLKEAVHAKPVGEFLSEISRWKDFAVEVLEQKTRGGKLGHGLVDKLPDLVEGVYKKLVTKKAVYSFVFSLLTGYYLIKLARWAQSHDNYEANRLLQEGPAETAKAPTFAATGKPAVAKPVEAIAKPAQSTPPVSVAETKTPSPSVDWAVALTPNPATAQALNAYTPNFTSLTAYSTDSNQFSNPDFRYSSPAARPAAYPPVGVAPAPASYPTYPTYSAASYYNPWAPAIGYGAMPYAPAYPMLAGGVA